MKMKRLYYFLMLGVLLVGCNDNENNTALDADEITFTKEGTLEIHKEDSTTVSLEIEFAETQYETATGLMYRESMREDRGMLFIFQEEQLHSFYMKNTEFPLDIIYIKQDQKIAYIVKNAKPFNEDGLSSEVPVQYVLEVNGGMTEKWNVKVGDSISWQKD